MHDIPQQLIANPETGDVRLAPDVVDNICIVAAQAGIPVDGRLIGVKFSAAAAVIGQDFAAAPGLGSQAVGCGPFGIFQIPVAVLTS